MANPKTQAAADTDYTRISTGLGKKISFGDDDPTQLTEFEGVYLRDGSYNDANSGESYDYFQFRDLNDADQIYFCWKTHELRVAMDQVSEGQQVKIKYLGSDPVDVGRVKKFAVSVKN